MKIFCPKCQWKPHATDLWECEPKCGHVWHTFDTRGQCPNCLKQWEKTQCFACNRLSPHLAWYHEDAHDQARWQQLIGEFEDENSPIPERELAPLER